MHRWLNSFSFRALLTLTLVMSSKIARTMEMTVIKKLELSWLQRLRRLLWLQLIHAWNAISLAFFMLRLSIRSYIYEHPHNAVFATILSSHVHNVIIFANAVANKFKWFITTTTANLLCYLRMIFASLFFANARINSNWYPCEKAAYEIVL